MTTQLQLINIIIIIIIIIKSAKFNSADLIYVASLTVIEITILLQHTMGWLLLNYNNKFHNMAVYMMCSQPLKIPKPVDQKMLNVNNCSFNNNTAVLHILKPVPQSTSWRCAMPWWQTTLVTRPNKAFHQNCLNTLSYDTRHDYHTMY